MILASVGWFLTHAVFGSPMHGSGYAFWSGIGSDFGEASILTALIIGLRHRNCHVKGCWRLGHPDPAHGHPACRHHHSLRDQLG
jgi:hypothetical protein